MNSAMRSIKPAARVFLGGLDSCRTTVSGGPTCTSSSHSPPPASAAGTVAPPASPVREGLLKNLVHGVVFSKSLSLGRFSVFQLPRSCGAAAHRASRCAASLVFFLHQMRARRHRWFGWVVRALLGTPRVGLGLSDDEDDSGQAVARQWTCSICVSKRRRSNCWSGCRPHITQPYAVPIVKGCRRPVELAAPHVEWAFKRRAEEEDG